MKRLTAAVTLLMFLVISSCNKPQSSQPKDCGEYARQAMKNYVISQKKECAQKIASFYRLNTTLHSMRGSSTDSLRVISELEGQMQALETMEVFTEED